MDLTDPFGANFKPFVVDNLRLGSSNVLGEINKLTPVVDLGFPVRGRRRAVGGGALTSDVGAFWQKQMQKRKNWILLGGGHVPAAPPLDPPMDTMSCLF